MGKPTRPDPAIGIWKLNVDKSSFAVAPAPKGSVMKVESWEDGLKMSTDTIDPQGNRIHLGRPINSTGSIIRLAALHWLTASPQRALTSVRQKVCGGNKARSRWRPK